ncbi:hypothetical protein [Pectobacterium aroidearum]|uniref:hypothetical protein n=1 Tax=Pectobacterium aroidearum TaxID=1201031 RepID=UPI0021147C29|nr:hypothetical protein [Pectobacterium aroidearum]UUE56483.1 hypothetical protein L0Y27_14820 [Pectobacterium aroidearum]UUE69190.1 hypothetical protein L0Y21_15710 [Pectobacterium aroidearum]UUE73560.1 hypothetical protein L0Y20_15820 [Pectobacterium aroidearum]UUE77899.1 hypothetical protein L0Y24_15260 [Pectobacterium aroidearum]
MPIFRESGGVFVPFKQLSINDGGTVKRVKAAWINDGGVFKKLFPTEPVDIADSPIFNAANSVKRWFSSTISSQKYWMLEINIPVIDGAALGQVTSSNVIVTNAADPQPIQYRISNIVAVTERPDGDAPNSVSPPQNSSTPIGVRWFGDARWITIPYNAVLVGTVLSIRIEISAGGTLYFYDTSATLIAI